IAATADKFSRLAALKPTRPIPARPAAIRTPDEADALGRLLGAGVARNHFGKHLSIRNWFSTPEFTDPSSTTLELLSRTRDESLSRKTRAALEDPEKWLFLDTETTGLAGGTGTYAFLIGLAWWIAGRAILYARLRRGTLAAARIISSYRRTAGACHLQWQIVRLAAARKSLHDDALHRGAEARGAP